MGCAPGASSVLPNMIRRTERSQRHLPGSGTTVFPRMTTGICSIGRVGSALSAGNQKYGFTGGHSRIYQLTMTIRQVEYGDCFAGTATPRSDSSRIGPIYWSARL